jgi:hypothetical protein
MAGVLLWTGCVADKPRLNSPPTGYAEPAHPMRDLYTYHNDQGMIADLSIADIHFVPHTAEISGTGEARLERYAELLASSGGTIRYDPLITDEALIHARIEAANAFLKGAVPGTRRVVVAMGLAGGRGMTAKESFMAKDVAKQAEPRKAAYYLNDRGRNTSSK